MLKAIKRIWSRVFGNRVEREGIRPPAPTEFDIRSPCFAGMTPRVPTIPVEDDVCRHEKLLSDAYIRTLQRRMDRGIAEHREAVDADSGVDRSKGTVPPPR